MITYRFRIYPSKAQVAELKHHLWIQKNLWNMLLEKTKARYTQDKTFYSKAELQAMVKESGIYSQSAQAVARRLWRAIAAKVRAKQKGQNWGFPRFKPFDRMKSILYPQFGFSLEKKLKVTSFGEIPIVQHRVVKGEIKTLTLKMDASGKWHGLFTVVPEPRTPKSNNGPSIGLDLGLNRLATLSNGNIVKNPHQFKRFEQKLVQGQQLLSRKRKGSHNRFKAKKRVALVQEKIANVRKNYLHVVANQLLSSYSKIVMEDLRINTMATKGHGKNIYDASWGMFTDILCYKAASAGSEILFVNPRNTSKECSRCHSMVEKSLQERVHRCSTCGLTLDRDVNAALNILARATAGMAGSKACGDGARALSVNQETTALGGDSLRLLHHNPLSA